MRNSARRLIGLVNHRHLPFPSFAFPRQYTSSNYLFAQSLEPENEYLKREVAIASQRLRKGEHTVPSTIAKELATNPFMRAHEPSIQARTGLGDGATTAAVLGKIRKMKNAF